MGAERRSLPSITPNATKARARLLALRRRHRPALGGRRDGLFGERDRGGRPLPRPVLLPEETDLLGAARRRLHVDGDPPGLPPARGAHGAAPDLRGRAAGPGAGAALRPGDQRPAALDPPGPGLVPA